MASMRVRVRGVILFCSKHIHQTDDGDVCLAAVGGREGSTNQIMQQQHRSKDKKKKDAASLQKQLREQRGVWQVHVDELHRKMEALNVASRRRVADASGASGVSGVSGASASDAPGGGAASSSLFLASAVASVLEVFGGEEGLKKTVDQVCELATQAVVFGGEAGELERARLNSALETLYYLNQSVNTAGLAMRVMGVSGSGAGAGAAGAGAVAEVADDALVAGVARFMPVDPEETSHQQQLLLYLLNCAQQLGYRRMGQDCYRCIRTPDEDAHDTRAWETACSIQEFVYEMTRKESNYNMWLCLTHGHHTLGSVVEHLGSCCDVQFPDLRKDRHVFSFRNGIYRADRDEFIAYGTPQAARLPSDLVSAKYFDAPFDQVSHAQVDPDDWAVIDTPHLQSILDFQDMSADVSRWMYVMIGRLIYEVGERDSWQVLPYLKGAASSGKSTILVRVCRALYDPADVGVMSNNIERKFGLSALYDKLLFVGPEMKADTSLEQAEFQSIVSGETVQVAVKFRTAQSVEWRVPGILAGNQVPGWVDNSGSINRRILLFDFPNRVDNGDMMLGQKLEREMPAILLKANRAYLHATRLHSHDNVWRHVPPEMVRSREELTEAVNSMVHFLRNSGALHFHASLVMPLTVFKELYIQYCKESNFRALSMAKDNYEQPLASEGCGVTSKVIFQYRGRSYHERCVRGVSTEPFLEDPCITGGTDVLGDDL